MLYVVATPIGNLADISQRAIQVLQNVDFIAAEDTRHSRHLLNHLGISKPMVSIHEHNERQQVDAVLSRLSKGESMALISDAGTPLISDPGYHLVKIAREKDIQVVPVPGACALVTALSVSGLPTDHFRFEGFLPSKKSARKTHLDSLKDETVTLVFYESSHRIADSIKDMKDSFGEDRQAILAREMTKTFETVLGNTLGEIAVKVAEDANQRKGEFVVVIKGAEKKISDPELESADALLGLLLEDLSTKQASRIVAKHTGLPKNEIYKRALGLQKNFDSSAK
ncbi:MAG: 16S rRNA (cytidine(1402)-2'-O)-methyltransferase [Gammaproteobacteria bacterium]|nr:16S rRNA (cytidine(1402)-2'-O)-methyltransferase [Gammaproteobacteria bacterium]